MFRINRKRFPFQRNGLVCFNSLCLPNNLWGLIKNVLQKKRRKIIIFFLSSSGRWGQFEMRAKREQKKKKKRKEKPVRRIYTPFHKNYYLDSHEIRQCTKQPALFPFNSLDFKPSLPSRTAAVPVDRFRSALYKTQIIILILLSRVSANWNHFRFFIISPPSANNVILLSLLPSMQKKSTGKKAENEYDKNRFNKWDEMMILLCCITDPDPTHMADIVWAVKDWHGWFFCCCCL